MFGRASILACLAPGLAAAQFSAPPERCPKEVVPSNAQPRQGSRDWLSDPASLERVFVDSLPQLPTSEWLLQTDLDALRSAWDYFGSAIDPSVDFCAQLVSPALDQTQYVGAIISTRPCWRVMLEDVIIQHRVCDQDIQICPEVRRDVVLWLDPSSGRLLKLHVPKRANCPVPFRERDRPDATARLLEFDYERWLALPKHRGADFRTVMNTLRAGQADEIVAAYVLRVAGYAEPEAVWSVELRNIPAQDPDQKRHLPQGCNRMICDAFRITGFAHSVVPSPLPSPDEFTPAELGPGPIRFILREPRSVRDLVPLKDADGR